MRNNNPNRINKAILKWFKKEGRNFPWRFTNDPYAILLAEKLLQQTAVRPGIVEIHQALLNRYPKVQDLAEADPELIKSIIFPLGLHYRANEIISMAKDIVGKYCGDIPNDLKSLISIYGIGDYSARAVLSFAYGKDVPVVDTNIARILFRVFGLPGKIPPNPARSRTLIKLAEGLIPSGKSKEFNWGLIDLGALICRPRRPACDICPLEELCDSRSKYDGETGHS